MPLALKFQKLSLKAPIVIQFEEFSFKERKQSPAKRAYFVQAYGLVPTRSSASFSDTRRSVRFASPI